MGEERKNYEYLRYFFHFGKLIKDYKYFWKFSNLYLIVRNSNNNIA